MPTDPTDRPTVEDPPQLSIVTSSLDPVDQTRNLHVFAACTGLIYLGAPLFFVGTLFVHVCFLKVVS